MKRISALLALFAVLTVALAAPALAGGGAKCEAADAQACLNQMSGMKAKGWTGLDLDKSDATAIKVKAITPGSPASKAGFAVGDVIVAINGASMADKEALTKAKGDWAVGQAVTYTVKRKNTEKALTAKLESMPEDVFASMIGKHMLAAHVAMASATPTTPSATPTTISAEKSDK